MKLKVKLFGTKETRMALERLRGKGGRAANAAVVDLSEQILEEVIASIVGGPKTGRIYRRYNPLRTHQASAPGQAPADDLGGLAASYSIQYNKLNQYVFGSTVGSTAVYAAKLEFGGGNTLPRPHLDPAVREIETQTGSTFVNAWRVA